MNSTLRFRLFVMLLGNLSVGTGALVLAGILTSVAGDLGLSLATTGQLMSVYAIFYAVGAPILNALTSSMERKYLLVMAVSILAVANLLGSLATGYAMMFASRAIAGLGGSIFTPSSAAMAAGMSEPQYRARAIGFVFAGISMATVLGVPLGTWIGNEYGWRITLTAIAIFASLVGVTLTIALPTGIKGVPFNLTIWKNLLSQSQITLSLLTSLLQMAAIFTLFTYLEPFLKHHAGIQKQSLTLYLAIFGTASVIGTFTGAIIADKVGLLRTIIISLTILSAMEFVMPAVSISIVAIIVCLAIWGYVCFSFHPALQARLVGLVPQPQQNIVLSLNASALYGGTALGSFLGGVVLERVGIQWLHLTGGTLAMLSLIVFFLSTRAEQETQEDPL